MSFPLGSEWCGIYIHIPFCRSKCHYCDFLSFAGSSREKMERYVETLLWEMENRIPKVTGSFRHFTIYLGGGTPTLLPARQLARILEKARELVPSPAEVTVEANPFTVNQELLEVLEETGVTRISLGIQSLHQRVLKVLGRVSGREEILRSLELTRQREFKLSVDLIYGAPLQTVGTLLKDICDVTDFGPTHVSAYSLTLEGDVPLQKAVEEGKHRLPEEEEWEEQMFTVKRALEERGYTQYEISNFAREGDYCLHNLIYWGNGSYLGLGLGGVSHLHGRRWGNPDNLARYLSMNISPGWEERLPAHRKAAETAMLMLRTRWGVPEDHPVLGDTSLAGKVEELCRWGLLEHRHHAFVIPERLLPVANEVLSRIVAEP